MAQSSKPTKLHKSESSRDVVDMVDTTDAEEHDPIRAGWGIGSAVLVYSRSKKDWIAAEIEQIELEDNGEEWMRVKYQKKTKRIQRYCEDIKAMPTEHPSQIKKGSKVKIRAEETSAWCDGEVVDIFDDDEGEWLKVKYDENDVSRICDVQRYSKDIKIIAVSDESTDESKQSDTPYDHQKELEFFPEIKHILIDTVALHSRLKELGTEITTHYNDVIEKDEELICVGILTGAVLFAADLVRHIKIAHRLEFMRVKSYSGSQQADEVKVLLDLSCNVEGKHVLIMEDMIDSGKTMMFLVDYLKTKKAKSVKVACLLQKKTKRLAKNFNVKIDWIGFPSVVDEWIIGYGIDYAQKYRHLPYIASLKESVYSGHAH